VVVPFAVIATGVVVLPLVGLGARVPWSDLATLISSPVVREALVLSVTTSLGAAAIATVLGVPLAYVLARLEVPGRSVLRAIVTLPMVLPPVVGGAALLFALGRRAVSYTHLRAHET